jgi:hypothetical protein
MTIESPLVCSHCAQPVEDRDIHFRFKLPDPLLKIPKAEREQRVRGDGDIVGASGIGMFARVLLPVKLTGGYQITYGTWLGLMDETEFDRARALWHAPEYSSLVLMGVLANAIEPWGDPLMTRARVAVRGPNEVPYVDAVQDESMAEVLTATWPRSWVLSAIPDAAWHRH